MNATFGLSGSNSSSSANLQQLLASRLRAKTDLDGSILYRLTWKARVTPSGRVICALRGSAARICASVYILSGWPTTTTRDWKDGQECPNVDLNCLLGRQVWMAGWPAPCQQDGPNGGPSQGINRLPGAVPMVDWNTPTSPVNTDGHQAGNNRYVTSVTEQTKPLTVAIRGKLQADGSMLTGSCAEILPENQAGAPLNPEHSRWIMRLPVEWAFCAPMVTRSMRKPRQTSAKSSVKSATKLEYDL